MTYFLVRTRPDQQTEEILAEFEDKDDAIIAKLLALVRGEKLEVRCFYDDPADLPDIR